MQTIDHTIVPGDTTISILIADDHPLILAGLASLINSMSGFRLLGQASTGQQALER